MGAQPCGGRRRTGCIDTARWVTELRSTEQSRHGTESSEPCYEPVRRRPGHGPQLSTTRSILPRRPICRSLDRPGPHFRSARVTKELAHEEPLAIPCWLARKRRRQVDLSNRNHAARRPSRQLHLGTLMGPDRHLSRRSPVQLVQPSTRHPADNNPLTGEAASLKPPQANSPADTQVDRGQRAIKSRRALGRGSR
jgi:hypothetical protein